MYVYNFIHVHNITIIIIIMYVYIYRVKRRHGRNIPLILGVDFGDHWDGRTHQFNGEDYGLDE